MNDYKNGQELFYLIAKQLLYTKKNPILRMVLRQDLSEVFFGIAQRRMTAHMVLLAYSCLITFDNFEAFKKSVELKLKYLRTRERNILLSRLFFIKQRILFLENIIKMI